MYGVPRDPSKSRGSFPLLAAHLLERALHFGVGDELHPTRSDVQHGLIQLRPLFGREMLDDRRVVERAEDGIIDKRERMRSGHHAYATTGLRRRGEPRTKCPGTESNRPHGDFQSPALPTELPGPPPGGARLQGRGSWSICASLSTLSCTP